MTKSFQAIAQRMDNAKVNFIETLMNLGGISKDEARKVMELYLKNKLARIDTGIGRIQVKHGAFLDREVILRAVAMAN